MFALLPSTKELRAGMRLKEPHEIIVYKVIVEVMIQYYEKYDGPEYKVILTV